MEMPTEDLDQFLALRMWESLEAAIAYWDMVDSHWIGYPRGALLHIPAEERERHYRVTTERQKAELLKAYPTLPDSMKEMVNDAFGDPDQAEQE